MGKALYFLPTLDRNQVVVSYSRWFTLPFKDDQTYPLTSFGRHRVDKASCLMVPAPVVANRVTRQNHPLMGGQSDKLKELSMSRQLQSTLLRAPVWSCLLAPVLYIVIVAPPAPRVERLLQPVTRQRNIKMTEEILELKYTFGEPRPSAVKRCLVAVHRNLGPTKVMRSSGSNLRNYVYPSVSSRDRIFSPGPAGR